MTDMLSTNEEKAQQFKIVLDAADRVKQELSAFILLLDGVHIPIQLTLHVRDGHGRVSTLDGLSGVNILLTNHTSVEVEWYEEDQQQSQRTT